MLYWIDEFEMWMPEIVRITGRKTLEPDKSPKNTTEYFREFKVIRELEKAGKIISSSAAQADNKKIARRKERNRES